MRIALTLRLRLLLLWLFMLAVCGALAFVIRDVYQLGTEAQTEKTLGLAKQACTALQTEYPRSIKSGGDTLDAVLMGALRNLILGELPGIEGGYWHEAGGFVAYAFPTHQGSEEKTDVPSTERNRIETLVNRSLAENAPVTELMAGPRETVVLTACPVTLPGARLGAWTMARVATATGEAYDEVNRGLALLLGFVLVSGVWLGLGFYRWSHHFRRVESELGRDATDALRETAPTGDTELDRIVAALNQFRARLQAARNREKKLGMALAQMERFAVLGRMAAAMAHEVRNPIAAMRLKAENALAHSDKHEAALHFVVKEIERLDATVRSLLSKAEPVSIHRREVLVRDWIAERIGSFGERAARAGVELRTQVGLESWNFDPVLLGRALDNLVANAVEHTPRGGTVTVSAVKDGAGASMILRVCDTGPGVAAGIEPRLFEPFVSGRSDGVGLGLTLVREIATAHGGAARYVKQASGTCFEIEIPWHAS
ncbi:MAG: HAMP domain-containing histidine kinase [Betaproteobacteria bacterium]|nr:HAMP domain-containing histidine kinase [Betaproteobacteria bacterium]